MEAIQWRHIKLAYAGKSANWELARYELGQMQESSDAARLYQGIPIDKVDMIEQPVMALSDAIRSKDAPRFTRAFADLTGACNSCHAAAQVGFITIQVPTAHLHLPTNHLHLKENKSSAGCARLRSKAALASHAIGGTFRDSWPEFGDRRLSLQRARIRPPSFDRFRHGFSWCCSGADEP
jgi:hypothetical protein